MSEMSRYQEVMKSIGRMMHDPANREPCTDCEGAGHLFTVSGRKVLCGECYGEGTRLKAGATSLWANCGGAIAGANPLAAVEQPKEK